MDLMVREHSDNTLGLENKGKLIYVKVNVCMCTYTHRDSLSTPLSLSLFLSLYRASEKVSEP